MNQGDLSERALGLLTALVQRYIRDGEPVGSRTLSRESGVKLSAATIRNVMADLEEGGYISSPHTSAGRVPTVQAYRLFVDSLRPNELSQVQQAQIEAQLRLQQADTNDQQLLTQASSILSELSDMAAIVTVPRRDYVRLRQLEFLPLTDKRVLAILVINQREVENRILHTHRNYSASELEQAANYLNRRFAGHSLQAARKSLFGELKDARQNMDAGLADAIRMAEQVFDAGEHSRDYVLSGQTRLLGAQGFSDVERLRDLFEAFTRKRDLLVLFDHCLQADGVQIFIGGESGYAVLDECSIVSTPYTVDGQVVGSLGVVGPTRMDYQRIVPLVQSTAEALGRTLGVERRQ